MCIYWGYSTIDCGDEVILKGRKIDDDKFLCWDIQIIRKKMSIETFGTIRDFNKNSLQNFTFVRGASS